MRKFLVMIGLASLSLGASAQAVSPQDTFSNAVSINSPSLWLNFNDATTAFVDQVSGKSFGPTSVAPAGVLATTTNTFGSGAAAVSKYPTGAGVVNSISIQGNMTAAGSIQVGVCSNTTGNIFTNSAHVTLALAVTNAVQTFTAPANFTAFPVAAGQYPCFLVTSGGTGTGPGSSALSAGNGWYYYGSGLSAIPASATYSLVANSSLGIVLNVTQSSAGTAMARQAGFDATNGSNYSAAFPYNAWNAAPNVTVSAFDWFNPNTMLVHIDRLNWSRSGTLVLASKGDIGSTSNSYWEMLLQMNGLASQVCFVRNGVGTPYTSGASSVIGENVCTASNFDVVPNGMNYDIMLTQDATGSGAGLSLYINGLLEATGSATGNGFGSAVVNASGGTGYANSTPFIGVGGGPNCTLAGSMVANSGVPATTNGFGFSKNYGCTSVPSITFNYSVPAALSIGNSCTVQLNVTATTAACTVSSVTAGSTILVGTLPANTTSVTDTNGTPVLLAGTPGGQGPIYYEANAASGTHSFTFTMAATHPTAFYYPQAIEIKGAAATSPIDTAAYAGGTGAAVSIGAVTTTTANEAIVGFLQTISTGGSSWTSPSNPFGLCSNPGNTSNCALGQAPAPGAYILNVTQGSSTAGWQGQIVAIKPGITVYAPTGTGVNLSYGLTGASMNSATNALMVPGYVSNGTVYGPGGANASQAPTNVDEFVLFPSQLSFGPISNLFYETKFYQAIANSATPKPVVILDDDTFADSDNELLLAMVIGAHKAGIITLGGVVVEDYTPAAIAAWRQILDSAGLNDVPVTIPPVSPGTSGYAATNVLAYNASTPLTLGAWGSSTAMYRSIFAKYPTTPIAVLLGGPVWGAYAAFTSSAADGVSSLTGLQLIAQNGANGGAIYAQGWLYDLSPSGGTIVANNQSMPIIWIEGTPMSGGPGALVTRTSNDPLWLWFNSAGSDVRQCYDCLTLEAAISSYFTFGVSMTATGGTGYAALTPFTLSGTGTNSKCQGSGYLTASSGALNGVEFAWGSSAVGSVSGVGSGCTATPTVTLSGSTGTGGTITAVPTACGAYAVSGGLPGSYATTTCANQYFVPGSFNTNQSPASGAMMTWLINSLVDPVPTGAAIQP